MDIRIYIEAIPGKMRFLIVINPDFAFECTHKYSMHF